MRTLILLPILVLAACHPMTPEQHRAFMIQNHCQDEAMAARGTVAGRYANSFGNGGLAAGMAEGAAYRSTYDNCLEQHGYDPYH